nr:MAG TPA: hypothetical protein [Caudoviricetes sp.]
MKISFIIIYPYVVVGVLFICFIISVNKLTNQMY